MCTVYAEGSIYLTCHDQLRWLLLNKVLFLGCFLPFRHGNRILVSLLLLSSLFTINATSTSVICPCMVQAVLEQLNHLVEKKMMWGVQHFASYLLNSLEGPCGSIQPLGAPGICLFAWRQHGFVLQQVTLHVCRNGGQQRPALCAKRIETSREER